MRSIWFTTLVLAAGITVAPRAADAQIFTNSFMGPRAGSSLGVYLSDLGDFAVEGILRKNLGSFDLGVRGGLAEVGDDAELTIGGEYRNPIAVPAPIDLAVTAGAQALVGDLDLFGLQAGLSIGSTFVPGTVSVSPYVHPRLAFVNGPGDDWETDLLADIGLDLHWATRLGLHLAIGLDDDSADWGIGLSWR